MHKIAIAQISSSTEKAENLKAALFLTQEARAKGAQLIAFPEFLMAFSPASQTAEELAALAESVDGSFVTAFRDAARAARIGILATIYERCSSSNRVYDTAVWIDNEGGIAAVYRKLHLYDAFGFKESDKFLAGDDIAPLVTNGDARIGIMICYDLRFPEMAARACRHGRAGRNRDRRAGFGSCERDPAKTAAAQEPAHGGLPETLQVMNELTAPSYIYNMPCKNPD
ncbi:MAG: hypothetical protein HYU46_15460 [Deltaproteobacteria bacterium]|nr:hypothetical protein [Deltaproteobacteria bacterium]